MLKFNKSTVIGLYAMMELAREPGETLTAAEIADRFHASRHHLVKVLQQLARAGLVESERGAAGGHRLAGRPQDVTLEQIVEVFEGPHQKDRLCLLMDPDAKAEDPTHCSLHPVFQQLSSMIVLKLQSISLQSLLAQGTTRAGRSGPTE